jgi:Ca-activated chloride channel family protein
MKKLVVMILLNFMVLHIPAQQEGGIGKVAGKIIDKATKESIFGAQVLLVKDGVRKAGVMSGVDGSFVIDSIPVGTYTVRVNYVGYPKAEQQVDVKPEKTAFLNFVMTPPDTGTVKCVMITHADAHLDHDNTTTGGSYSREEIHRAPTRSINSIAASTAGTTANGNTNVTFKGSRSSSTVYYVDGVQVNSATPKLEEVDQQKVARSTDFNTEEYSATMENEWKQPLLDPLSTFSIDVDKASYSNVRRYLNSGQLPPKDAVRIEELINYFHYNYPQPEGDVPFSITNSMADCPWAAGHKLVEIGMQGRIIPDDKLPASNLVFLIDVSGSMDEPNKLPLVKRSLEMLVQKMRAEDKITIVVYAGNAGLVLPPTPSDQKEKIRQAIDRLEAGGSTAGGEGIELAYKMAKENFIKDGNNRVILSTDGDFNVGVSSEGDLARLIEEKRKDGIYLTVLGFGMGNYKDNKMEQLADKGNGNYAYIDDITEAEKTLVSEFGGTMYTIAKDVKLQVEWNPQVVKGYRLIGYEDRIMSKEDFNDDKKDAGELGSGHTVTALYEIIPVDSKEKLPSVDSLKYQPQQNAVSTYSNEVMTVKLRYKNPKEDKSRLLSFTMKNETTAFEKAPENLRWAASVASFGMLLRDSQYKGNAQYAEVKKWAKAARREDEEGYRAEFIKMLNTASTLSNGISKK